MAEKQVLQVRMEEDLRERLKETAGKHGITMSELVRRLLVLSLNEVEAGNLQVTAVWERSGAGGVT